MAGCQIYGEYISENIKNAFYIKKKTSICGKICCKYNELQYFVI